MQLQRQEKSWHKKQPRGHFMQAQAWYPHTIDNSTLLWTALHVSSGVLNAKYGARQPSVLAFQSHAAENHYAEFDDTHSWSSRVRQIESAAMVNASSSSEFTTQIVIILGCFWNYPLTPQGRHAWQICHTIAVVLIFQLPDKSHRNPVSLAHRYNHKMKHTARNQSVEALLFVLLLSSLEFLV